MSRKIVEAPTSTMDTSLIQPFSGTPEHNMGAFVKAVLFATGELKRLENDSEVYGLVLAGYEGLRFGDDGTVTAMVAAELPLERWEGVRTLEDEIEKALKEVNPAYCAEYIGTIALGEATVMLDVSAKQEAGVETPRRMSWDGGTYTSA